VQNVAARCVTDATCDGRKSIMNLADEVQSVLTRLTNADEDFVQAVNVQLRGSPSVILFTQEQISDIRTFCYVDTLPSLRAVLAFDRAKFSLWNCNGLQA